MSQSQVVEQIETGLEEIFPLLEQAFGVELGEYLSPDEIVVTTLSDPRVTDPNAGEHLMESYSDGDNYYLILYPEKIKERGMLHNQAMLGHELSHIAKDVVGRPEYESLDIEPEVYPHIGDVKVSDLLKTRTVEEFIARVGETKVAVETDTSMGEIDISDGPDLVAPNYERGVDVRNRLWDLTLREVQDIIPDGLEMLNMVYHEAGYRAAEEKIVEALDGENLLQEERSALWGKKGYNLDSYEQDAFDKLLTEEENT